MALLLGLHERGAIRVHPLTIISQDIIRFICIKFLTRSQKWIHSLFIVLENWLSWSHTSYPCVYYITPHPKNLVSKVHVACRTGWSVSPYYANSCWNLKWSPLNKTWSWVTPSKYWWSSKGKKIRPYLLSSIVQMLSSIVHMWTSPYDTQIFRLG